MSDYRHRQTINLEFWSCCLLVQYCLYWNTKSSPSHHQRFHHHKKNINISYVFSCNISKLFCYCQLAKNSKFPSSNLSYFTDSWNLNDMDENISVTTFIQINLWMKLMPITFMSIFDDVRTRMERRFPQRPRTETRGTRTPCQGKLCFDHLKAW